MIKYRGRIVSVEAAQTLQRLGCPCPLEMSQAEVLAQELAAIEDEVDPDTAGRLGRIIDAETAKGFAADEQAALRQVARRAKFLSVAGDWLTSDKLVGDDEVVLAALIPDTERLDPTYLASNQCSLALFRLARANTGMDPEGNYKRWLAMVEDRGVRVAVLRAAIGERGKRLAAAIRDDPPPWLPRDRRTLREFLVALGLSREEQTEVINIALEAATLMIELEARLSNGPDGPVTAEGQELPFNGDWTFDDLYDWWLEARVKQRITYDERQYPSDFAVTDLADPEDDLDEQGRIGWFTMLALARFQAMGRQTEEQHRGFIARASQEGWWQQLASRPPDEYGRVWLERLQSWTEPAILIEDYEHWRTTFVDLYAIARYLPDYARMVAVLPVIIGEAEAAGRSLTFDELLRPGTSSLWRRLGTRPRSFRRTLNSGINWLIRELVRHGFYAETDVTILAPYGWTATQRVRGRFGGLTERNPDNSVPMFEEVAAEIGADRAQFLGDLDLPLQLATHDNHRADFMDWLGRRDIEAAR